MTGDMERCRLGDMPRQARLDAPGALHHVMCRGIEGISISRSEEASGEGEEDILSDVVGKLGYVVVSVSRFLGMTTSSVNRITRPEEITELAR